MPSLTSRPWPTRLPVSRCTTPRPYQGASGWQVYGGTSAASPIIASVYTLSGNTSGYPASWTWSHTSGLFDVTSGSNGSCSPSLWCHAGTGWDGPTGLGTPNGTSAF